MSFELVANVVIAGFLTGLVYGLMALGLSVIFGVVRVVNFAHGEMMTVAMYAATLLFSKLEIDPFLAVVPVAAVFFVLSAIKVKFLLSEETSNLYRKGTGVGRGAFGNQFA